MDSKHLTTITQTLEDKIYYCLNMHIFPMRELEAYLHLLVNEKNPNWKMIDWLSIFIHKCCLSDFSSSFDAYWRYEELVETFDEYLASIGHSRIPF